LFRFSYFHSIACHKINFFDSILVKTFFTKLTTGDSVGLTTFVGKTERIAATMAGFSSRDTYRRAKKVVLRGIPELIKAMDRQQLSPNRAAKIAQLPPLKQHNYLRQQKLLRTD
jgi:hypothetical protein